MEHISDHDLERYQLGIVVDEAELAPLEEHLVACPECVERAEQTAEYVDTLRAAIIVGNFDLEQALGGQHNPTRFPGRSCARIARAQIRQTPDDNPGKRIVQTEIRHLPSSVGCRPRATMLNKGGLGQ
jgi:hypothetical protein